jgi:ketosteroid isomerase-like protein
MTDRSTAEKNKAIIADFFNTAESNLEDFFTRLVSNLHPNFVAYEAPGLPSGGEYHGPEGFTRLQEKIRDELLDIGVEDLEFVAEGNYVMTMFRLVGTSKSSGRRFDMRTVEVWQFEGGKLISLRPFYYDTHEVRKIIGVD